MPNVDFERREVAVVWVTGRVDLPSTEILKIADPLDFEGKITNLVF